MLLTMVWSAVITIAKISTEQQWLYWHYIFTRNDCVENRIFECERGGGGDGERHSWSPGGSPGRADLKRIPSQSDIHQRGGFRLQWATIRYRLSSYHNDARSHCSSKVWSVPSGCSPVMFLQALVWLSSKQELSFQWFHILSSHSRSSSQSVFVWFTKSRRVLAPLGSVIFDPEKRCESWSFSSVPNTHKGVSLEGTSRVAMLSCPYIKQEKSPVTSPTAEVNLLATHHDLHPFKEEFQFLSQQQWLWQLYCLP